MSLSPALSVTTIDSSSSISSSATVYHNLNSHSSLSSLPLPNRPHQGLQINHSPYRIHTHHVTLGSPTHTISIEPDDNTVSEENISFCLADDSNGERTDSSDQKGQSVRRRRACCDYFPLTFDIAQTDGGHFSPTYSVQNILHDDSTVYCSGRRGTINILLKFNPAASSGGKYKTLPCVLSQLIIRSPRQGFTAPCKEGMIFISHHPIDLKATEKFDRFTREDFIAHSARQRSQIRNCNQSQISAKEDGYDPVAWFHVRREQQQCIDLGERSGRYVMLKLLRSENEADNIDLQYVGLMGYFGARSFAIGSLC
ncbi:hypothetical protein BGW37DRAFT_87575 [Umbelopsis sp. PMI_123]|nr:hypothetical protein BGW37DRAFT_87575 [Umbelopsis sp. PMI_123]